MKLYGELASWWSVLRPVESYAEQAAWIIGLSEALAESPVTSLLELGSATGHLAANLPASMDVVLVDASESMLQLSRDLNPEHRHVQADLRTVRLEQVFDVVVLHDAVMYMLTEGDLAAALETCAAHLASGGVAAVLPDLVRESFEERTVKGAGKSVDGRSARLTERHWDPDPEDTTTQVDFTLRLRETDGTRRTVRESHQLGVFDRPTWARLVEAAGFDLHWAELPDELGLGECFLLRRR